MAEITVTSYTGEDLKSMPAMGRGGVPLPLEVSKDIWQVATENSFVLTHGTAADMPPGGKEFSFLTSEPEAAWVSEGGRKPLGMHTFGRKTFRPYKAALIESFSDEFKRDRAAQYNMLRPRLGLALGRLFDRAILLPNGSVGKSVPGEDFSHLGAIRSVDLDGNQDTFLNIMIASGADGAYALSRAAQLGLYRAKDAQNNPLFIPDIHSAPSLGTVLGSNVYVTEAVRPGRVKVADATNASQAGYTALTDANGNAVVQTAPAVGDQVGIYGPWSEIGYGYVQGITYEEYDGPIFRADGTLVHAGRQDNMSSVIVEVEIGSLIRDASQFISLRADDPATQAPDVPA